MKCKVEFVLEDDSTNEKVEAILEFAGIVADLPAADKRIMWDEFWRQLDLKRMRRAA